MRTRTISTQTTLEPYGLVRITGTVARNPFHTFEERQFEPAWIVNDLTVVGADGETIQGWTRQGEKNVYVCTLDQFEVDQCEEVLVDKYTDDELSVADRMVDEAIERGREYKHMAYA